MSDFLLGLAGGGFLGAVSSFVSSTLLATACGGGDGFLVGITGLLGGGGFGLEGGSGLRTAAGGGAGFLASFTASLGVVAGLSFLLPTASSVSFFSVGFEASEGGGGRKRTCGGGLGFSIGGDFALTSFTFTFDASSVFGFSILSVLSSSVRGTGGGGGDSSGSSGS